LRSGQLRLEGKGNLDGDYRLAAKGEFPVAAAGVFFKDVPNIEGYVSVQVEVKGSGGLPELSGEIVLRDLGYNLPQIDQTLAEISGKIRLTSSLVTVEDVTGRLGSGIFRISGEVELEEFRPGTIQLALKGEKLPIQVPDTMDVRVDADLLATGTVEGLTVRGDIILLESLYYKDVKINLARLVQDKRQNGASSAVESEQTFFDRIRYNIQLKYREPFIVDNNIAYLEIIPDLVISGTRGAPVITGVAKVQAGTLNYQNRAFVVERGIVTFDNPYAIEPQIDIMGEVQVRHWRILLTLSGPPDQLNVALTSTPAEEDGDILSLIVFGKTTTEISGGESGAFDSAESMLAQLVASSYGEDIKKTTGLDYLEVETEKDEEEEDPNAVKVTMGKDLTERMTLKYTFGSGADSYSQGASMEYRLIEHILLSGFQNTRGNYGGEIIFRVEFRSLW
jgi:autotransporter translocation and assembly factor TamB